MFRLVLERIIRILKSIIYREDEKLLYFIVDFFQVGITSWGIGCGQSGVPGAYASISSSLCFIDWAIKCKEQTYYQDYIDIKVFKI